MADVAVDLIAEDHGALVLIRGITNRGHAWIAKHCSADGYQAFRPSGWVVQPQHVFAILKGAIADALQVA
jgi:hypothetical protein